jgi:hypothetical protein
LRFCRLRPAAGADDVVMPCRVVPLRPRLGWARPTDRRPTGTRGVARPPPPPPPRQASTRRPLAAGAPDGADVADVARARATPPAREKPPAGLAFGFGSFHAYHARGRRHLSRGRGGSVGLGRRAPSRKGRALGRRSFGWHGTSSSLFLRMIHGTQLHPSYVR